MIVALIAIMSSSSLGLNYLSEQGYDYELWRVDPQSGGKVVIAASRPGTDFPKPKKQAFTCQPSGRSVFSPSQAAGLPAHLFGITAYCVFVAGLLSALSYLLYKQSHCNRTLKRLASRDRRTGLYNQPGFTAGLTAGF